jgi:geranylgeranyl reductase family protein
MPTENFDVIIIGAGPAGSHAAERLAENGARVALFDGRPEDHAKPCGGGVTSKALKAWPHLMDAVGRLIDALDLYSPAGKRIHLKLNEPFAVYSRTAFDGYLRDRARDAGAKLISERVSFHSQISRNGSWNVTLKDGSELNTPMLVAADGANSAIAKSLSGPLAKSDMEVAFGYRAPLPVGDNAATVVAFPPGWDGYVWAFPRIDHISFGVATSQATFDQNKLDFLLWNFMIRYYERRLDRAPMSEMPRLEFEMKKEKLAVEVEQYSARIPKLRRETLENRRTASSSWALLGDAAGFADAVTGEGIFYALRSAELFADSYLGGNAASYEDAWRADFGQDLATAAKLRDVFYGDFLFSSFTNRMVQFAILHPGIRRTLVEMVAGDLKYSKLKGTLLRRLVWPV